MALQQKITLKNGITLPEGYWRLTSCSGEDKTEENKQPMMFTMALYRDAAAREEGLESIMSVRLQFDYDLTSDKNTYQQAYEFALTRPEFADAISV